MWESSTALVPVRTVAPATLPVSLEEIKRRVGAFEFDDDDALLQLCLEAAIARVDGWAGILGRALITQTWKANAQCWPPYRFRLPLSPVQSIATIKYYDTDGVLQTWAATNNWALYTDGLGPYAGWLGTSFPSLYSRADAIEVTFVAGYGSAPESVPAPIRVAIGMIASHLYDNRGVIEAGRTVAEVPMGAMDLLGPYRMTVL